MRMEEGICLLEGEGDIVTEQHGADRFSIRERPGRQRASQSSTGTRPIAMEN